MLTLLVVIKFSLLTFIYLIVYKAFNIFTQGGELN